MCNHCAYNIIDCGPGWETRVCVLPNCNDVWTVYFDDVPKPDPYKDRHLEPWVRALAEIEEKGRKKK